MKRNRLLVAAFFVLISCSGQAQWGALARFFAKGTGEAAAARAATRSFEHASAIKLSTHALEDAAARSSSILLNNTSRVESKGLSSSYHIDVSDLNSTERHQLDIYLSKATEFEKERLKYVPQYRLKQLLASLNDPPPPNYTPKTTSYELYSEPALDYSETAVTIQKELRKRGYNIKVDGRFGDKTKTAVSKALRKNSIISFPHEQALEVSKRDLFKNYKSKFIGLHESSFVNRMEFNHNNNLFLSKKINIKNADERNEIVEFYTNFFKNFENKKETFSDARFVTVCKTQSGTYVGYHYKEVGGKGVNGGLINFDKASEKQKETCLEVLFRSLEVKKVYVYGDEMAGLEKLINEKAWQRNATVLNRNTTFGKSFDQTQASLKKLANKRINSSRLSFFNGTPNSEEEAVFQAFKQEHVEIFQSFNSELSQAVLPKNATVISTKEQLIEELTNGTNDFLFIVAHCDGEKIYFGSSFLSIDELQALPARTGRKNPRTAVLFSCTTGDIYRNMPFENKPKAFAQLLVDKKYFDFVIAPPGNINGGDVLRMTAILDKYPISELDKQLSKLLDNGEMRLMGSIIDQLKKESLENRITMNK